MEELQSSASLPAGWSEHIGPQGQTYYYNDRLDESTYHRPSKEATSTATNQQKKERIVQKDPVAGTEGWVRVTTNRGNVFFAHLPSKRSQWSLPDEIRTEVEEMEREAERMAAIEEVNRQEEQRRIEFERRKEAIRAEKERRLQAEEARRRKEAERRARNAEAQRIHEERIALLRAEKKRELEENNDHQDGMPSKKQRVAQGETEIDGNASDDDEAEMAWQRSLAAEMAAEAEGVQDASQSDLPIQTSVDISQEDAKAIFMHMLTSLNGTAKEINPMMPWDRESPKFVDHRDYDVLPSMRDREDAFNEWCKLRLREKRNMKNSKAASSARENDIDPTTKHGGESSSADFQSLLKKEVVSTRTRWEDFRRTWKRDARFYRFGRDDRDRETAFQIWLKELGEIKRKAAAMAESAFVQLLEASLDRTQFANLSTESKDRQQDVWAQTKRDRNLDRDPRYDAVGSSSRRFELFKDWSKGAPPKTNGNDGDTGRERDQKIQDTKHAPSEALKKREEEVRRQRRKAEMEKARTSGLAVKDGSRTAFQQLLIDNIHDPLATLPHAFDGLRNDTRFSAPGLNNNDREELFFDHMDRLNERRLKALEAVFVRHAPTLDVDEEEALPLILDDDELSRRSLAQLRSLVNGRKNMRDLFGEWNERREQEARQAFRQMLKENAFVDFWGRLRQEYELRKSSEQPKNQNNPKSGADGEEEEEDVPDLLQMAASVDLDEIHAVLERDPRYRAFDHRASKRSQWIREYLQSMQIPKKTVFQI